MANGLSAAQQAALAALAADGTISAAQHERLIGALAQPPGARLVRRLPEVLSYFGGALLLGGSLLLIEPLEPYWTALSLAARVSILAGLSLLAAAAGTVAAGIRGPRSAAASLSVRQRLGAVLYVIAAIIAAGAAGELTQQTAWTALTGLAIALCGYLAIPSALGVAVMAAFSGVTVYSFLDTAPPQIWPGLALVATGLLWGGLTAARVIRQHHMGYLAALAIAFTGTVNTGDSFVLTYLLTFLIAIVCFAGYSRDRSPILLTAGISGLAIAACELTADLTEGAATPAIVLIAGAALLLISAFLLRRRPAKAAVPATAGS